MRIHAVLFDFAGTLFMPRPANELLLNAGRKLGLELGPDESERLADACVAAGFPGGPYPDTVPDHLRKLYEARDLSSDAHRRAYTGLLSTVALPHPSLAAEIYEQIREPSSWVPYIDARALLDQLRQRGVAVGVVSNAGFDLRPILRAHGFEELACNCTLSFEVGATKPDRRIFDAALRAVRSDPTRTLMVGDHQEMDGGAEALGMKTLILPMTPARRHHGLSKVLQVV